jgi:hypothetical protein
MMSVAVKRGGGTVPFGAHHAAAIQLTKKEGMKITTEIHDFERE